jgi:MFS family permease
MPADGDAAEVRHARLTGMGTSGSLGSGFRALWFGSLVSNMGDGIRLAALPLLATSLTSSPLLISVVAAAQYLPWAVFAPVGGALVDRWDRRRTILVTQVWRGLVMAGLGALVWTGVAEIWHVCVVAFVITVGEILVDPSTVALVPTLVEDSDLDRANGQIASVEIVTNDFAGGPVGAAVFGLAPWLPFLLDGATYVGSLLPFGRLPKTLRAPVARDDAQSVTAEAAEGFRWLRQHPVLGPFTAAQVVNYFGFAAGFSLLVVLVTDELESSSFAFGLILATGAAGAFVGSLIGSRVSAIVSARASLAGAVALQGATLAVAAATRSVPALAVVWFFNGLPAGVQRPIARTMQQRLTPNHLLGRVNVTSRIFTRGVIVLGALCAGVIAVRSGVRWSFVVGGVSQLVAAAMVWNALGRGDMTAT